MKEILQPLAIANDDKVFDRFSSRSFPDQRVTEIMPWIETLQAGPARWPSG